MIAQRGAGRQRQDEDEGRGAARLLVKALSVSVTGTDPAWRVHMAYLLIMVVPCIMVTTVEWYRQGVRLGSVGSLSRGSHGLCPLASRHGPGHIRRGLVLAQGRDCGVSEMAG